MGDSSRDKAPIARPTGRRAEETSPPWAVLGVTVFAAIVAGAAGHLIPGAAGWVASGVLAVLGGASSLVLVKGPSEHIDVALRRQIRQLEEEKKTAGPALLELESLKRQIEVAISSYKSNRDPLAAGSELGLGPLNALLEAARDAAKSGPVVSRIAIDEAELVGADGVPLPEPWPADADNPPSFDPRVRAEALRGLDALVSGLESLTRMLSRPIPAVTSQPGNGGAARTPAQLVDEVVHTAADGIEDLAAGLMRANELASVAERVTNRATLLALNAALEATRSGSEAFAAIAEETRRLAEFAREATDTISRLASEIEYKVGETITAIHSTSEDAKIGIAALSGSPPPTVTLPPTHLDSVEGLLSRAREVRQTLTAVSGSARGGAGTGSSGSGGSGGSGGRGSGNTSGSGSDGMIRSGSDGMIGGGLNSGPSDFDEASFQIERASRLEEPPDPRGSAQSQDDDVPMREVPPPIELASDLAPETPHSAPPRDDAPPEHLMMLERLKPNQRYPS
jgi:hypothetical protein